MRPACFEDASPAFVYEISGCEDVPRNQHRLNRVQAAISQRQVPQDGPVRYSATRLLFKVSVIEQLNDDDAFQIVRRTASLHLPSRDDNQLPATDRRFGDGHPEGLKALLANFFQFLFEG